MVGSGGGVGEVLAKEAAEQTQSNALKVSFEEEVDRMDARLALKDLPSAERAELERERETLLKRADYLGVERRMTREEREKGPPVLDDPAEQVMTSADFGTRTQVDNGNTAMTDTAAKENGRQRGREQ